MGKNKQTILIVVNNKNDRHRTTKHHRKPRSAGGLTNKANISKVKAPAHRAFHSLFVNGSGHTAHPEKIASRLIVLHRSISDFMLDEDGKLRDLPDLVEEINKVWLDPDYSIKLIDDEDTEMDEIA